MSCKHWSNCGVHGGGCCAIGNFGGRPSRGTCAVCQDNTEGQSDPTKVHHEPLTAGKILHGAVGVTKAVLGIDPAPATVIARRTAICKACPEAISDPAGNPSKCRICGCGLRFKLALAKEECPHHRWAKSGNTVAVVQLSRFGDLCVSLPWVRELAKHQKVKMVVHQRYLSLVQGLSYLKPVPFDGYEHDVVKAKELAATVADEVIASHVNGNPVACEAANFVLANWKRAGFLDRYHELPLILDNRDFDAEEELYRRHRRDYRGPLILLNTAGHSSPYEGGEELTKWVSETWGGKVPVIDLTHVRANRIQDLLGLYERATVLISTDTATLHLGYATNTPTVALVNDKPWYASEKRNHWIGRVTYSESRTEAGRSQIAACVEGALVMIPPVQPRILHVVDAWAPEATADRARLLNASQTRHAQADNWRVLYCRPSRTSETIGDTRRLPFVRDVFDFAVDRAAEDDLIVFTNSDISLVPEASAVIRDALRARPCAYGRRVDVDDDKTRTRADLSGGCQYSGIDLFAFKPQWWRDVRGQFPDMVLGCEAFDSILLILMRESQAVEMPGVIYHRRHQAFWSRHENVRDNPAQKHNRQLATEFVRARGLTRLLNTEINHHTLFREF